MEEHNMEKPLDGEVISRRGLLKSAGILSGVMLGSGLFKAEATHAAGGDTPTGSPTMASMADGSAMADGNMVEGNMDLMRTASGGPVPGLSRPGPIRASANSATNDLTILNAALLLEYLEAEFYTRVVAADAQRSYLRGRVRDVAQVLQRDETTHVRAVSSMIRRLGGTPIQKPGFQFPVDVFISPIAFLELSAKLEETGVGAYLGAAPQVKIKDVLVFAASIYGTETRHAGLIHHLRGAMIAPRDMERPLTIEEAVARANPYIVKDTMEPAGSMNPSDTR